MDAGSVDDLGRKTRSAGDRRLHGERHGERRAWRKREGADDGIPRRIVGHAGRGDERAGDVIALNDVAIGGRGKRRRFCDWRRRLTLPWLFSKAIFEGVQWDSEQSQQKRTRNSTLEDSRRVHDTHHLHTLCDLTAKQKNPD